MFLVMSTSFSNNRKFISTGSEEIFFFFEEDCLKISLYV